MRCDGSSHEDHLYVTSHVSILQIGMIDTDHRDPFHYGSNHDIFWLTVTLVPDRPGDALSPCFRVGLSPSVSPRLNRHHGGSLWAPSSQSRTRSARWEGARGVS